MLLWAGTFDIAVRLAAPVLPVLPWLAAVRLGCAAVPPEAPAAR